LRALRSEVRGQPRPDGAHLEEFLRAPEIREDNVTDVISALHGPPAGQTTHSIPEVWLLILSLVFLVEGCAAAKPQLRPFQPTDFMRVYPSLATLMEAEGDLPPRAGCPIGFGVLDTSALNAWAFVLPEPRKPPPAVKALGETREAPRPVPTPPPPRCRQFSLIVTSSTLALPPDELRAVIAHELGHVYLRHIQSQHVTQLLRNGAELFVIGLIPYLVLHADTYPFMSAFSGSQEADADRFAVELLVRSGSSCTALAKVLERFQRVQGRPSIQKFEWLSSHPSPERRIEAVRELCRDRPGQDGLIGTRSR